MDNKNSNYDFTYLQKMWDHSYMCGRSARGLQMDGKKVWQVVKSAADRDEKSHLKETGKAFKFEWRTEHLEKLKSTLDLEKYDDKKMPDHFLLQLFNIPLKKVADGQHLERLLQVAYNAGQLSIDLDDMPDIKKFVTRDHPKFLELSNFVSV